LTQDQAKCIDTYIALSIATNTITATDDSAQSSEELHHVFSNGVNGSASTSAAHTSTTTPFSQSAVPSKSLLSREDSAIPETIDAGSGSGSIPLSLSPKTQEALQGVIRRLFERCYEEGAYRQVVGIAVEARNLHILRETVSRATGEGGKRKTKDNGSKREELMDYLLELCLNVIEERVLRNEVSPAHYASTHYLERNAYRFLDSPSHSRTPSLTTDPIARLFLDR